MVGGMNKGKERGEAVGGQRKAFLLHVEFTSPVHRLVVLEEAQIVSPFVNQVRARLLGLVRDVAGHTLSLWPVCGCVQSHPSRLSTRSWSAFLRSASHKLSSRTCETPELNLKESWTGVVNNPPALHTVRPSWIRADILHGREKPRLDWPWHYWNTPSPR